MFHINEQPESLGDKLKKINDELEAANIKSAQEKANADLKALEEEKRKYQDFVDTLEKYIVDTINDGKYPHRKVDNYALQSWVKSANDNKAKFQFVWDQFVRRMRDNKLEICISENHDGGGIKSWITISVKPRLGTYRG